MTVTVIPSLFALGYEFYLSSDTQLDWNNPTYISQQTAKNKADAMAAAKAAAAEAAAIQKAAKADYQKGYNFIINDATISYLTAYGFYGYLSPGGKSMTQKNAEFWCYRAGWGNASNAWIAGCAKAAQIIARR